MLKLRTLMTGTTVFTANRRGVLKYRPKPKTKIQRYGAAVWPREGNPLVDLDIISFRLALLFILLFGFDLQRCQSRLTLSPCVGVHVGEELSIRDVVLGSDIRM